jgi:RNA polymerase sigma-70 factor (ECF subfamily)
MEDLVLRAQQGDLAAFEQIYRDNVGRVFALCLRLAGSREQAEELTQETFIRAWKGLGTYRPGSRFRAWLRTVALNVFFSDRRSRRRRQRWETRPEDPDRWDPPARAAEPQTGLDLERAIARLPRGARQVFVLHDLEGLRHEEIGRRLGLSAGTSKAQLHRARKLLREVLSQ